MLHVLPIRKPGFIFQLLQRTIFSVFSWFLWSGSDDQSKNATSKATRTVLIKLLVADFRYLLNLGRGTEEILLHMVKNN